MEWEKRGNFRDSCSYLGADIDFHETCPVSFRPAGVQKMGASGVSLVHLCSLPFGEIDEFVFRGAFSLPAVRKILIALDHGQSGLLIRDFSV